MNKQKTINTFKDLLIWQKGMDIVLEVYKIVASFPAEEKYGLTSQIKRSAISIPSNIAEGWGRNSSKSYAQFLKIARGSLLELETQIIIAHRLTLLGEDDFEKLSYIITEESKMLNAFIKKIELAILQSNKN